MKHIIAIAVFALASVAAHAGSIGGGANLGGSITAYSGTLTGATTTSFNSSVTSAAETIGQGSSVQSASNITRGTTSVGGGFNANGATTNIGGNLTSVSTTFGNTTGNSPFTDSTGAIDNGSQAFGTGTQAGSVGTTFNKGSVGGSLAVNGAAYGYQGFAY